MYHDLLGMMQHPHHAKVTPKFCKQYSAVGAVIQEVGRVSTAHWCWCWCCPALQLSLPCAWLLASPHCPEVSAGGFQALSAYHTDVVSGQFPSQAFSPYKIAPDETQQLLRDLEREGLDFAAEAVADLAAGAAAGAAR